MRTQIAALLALAAHVHAIKITSPSKNDEIDPSKGVTVKWSTVNTDPSTAHLVLVNMAAGNTPFEKDLGEVDLSSGSYTVSEKDVPNGEGYQFNFESVESQNTGILAQSEQFEIKASSDDDDESSSSSSASSTSSTATTTGSSSASTALVTNTITTSGTTVTQTTMTTLSPSTTGTSTDDENATETATTSTSTGAAAPTGVAIQAGSLFALVAGVAAVVA